jgi:hypothetical protein
VKRLRGCLDICGTIYRSFLGTRRDFPGMADCYGEVDEERQELHVESGMTKDRTEVTEMHEALHALLKESGADQLLADKEKDPTSETFVRVLATHLARTTRLRWLK